MGGGVPESLPAPGKLCLFTTLDLSPHELLDLYRLRWNIETDLRSLKRTVNLHHLHSKAVAMAEKEIVLAVAAYNLVRAILFLAAHRAGLAPRQLSFAGAHAAVMAALPGLDRASSTAEYNQRMDCLLDYVMQARLPHRKRKRSYPRRVWGQGASFPTHRSKPIERPNHDLATKCCHPFVRFTPWIDMLNPYLSGIGLSARAGLSSPALLD